MADHDNIRDLLSSLPPDEQAEKRRVLDLIEHADPLSDGSSNPIPAGGEAVRSDDDAWKDLSHRLRVAEHPDTRRGRNVRRPAQRRGNARWARIRVLAPTTAVAACLALAIWFNQSVELSAGAGDTTTVSLPDGSSLRLNSGSTVKYPRHMGSVGSLLKLKRSVAVTGEVFFEVGQDANRPFIVSTDNASLTVIGTSFNVRARHESGVAVTRVTLITGSLEVAGSTRDGITEIVRPGQTVEVAGTGAPVTRTDVAAQHAVSWLDGGFSYSNEPLAEIVAEIARRYRVRVELGEDIDLSQQMTLHYADAASPAVIIHDLCLSAGFNYRRVSGGFRIEPGS